VNSPGNKVLRRGDVAGMGGAFLDHRDSHKHSTAFGAKPEVTAVMKYDTVVSLRGSRAAL
jgi:hypothetical protein